MSNRANPALSVSFTVPDNVTKVVIAVAGREKITQVNVNGEAHVIETIGTVYTNIEVDTTSNKTVEVTTAKPNASGDMRAFMDSITYIGYAD